MQTLAKIPSHFSDDSRVWVFQSSRRFLEKEIEEINEQLKNFYLQWKSHGDEVLAWAEVLFQQFVVIIADESESKVSGCSTDGMTRIIKSLEKQYQVQLFDRLTLSFLINEKVEMLPMAQIPYAIQTGRIGAESLLFNNTVLSKKELLEQWLVPLKESWLWPRVSEKMAEILS